MSQTRNNKRVTVDYPKERQDAFEAIKNALLSNAKSIKIAEENEEEIDYDARNEALDYTIREEKRHSRKKWDRYLIRMVVVGFTLSYLMMLAIGLGWLDFGDNAFAVPTVVAAGVLETFGLAKIAAGYNFSDDGGLKKK